MEYMKKSIALILAALMCFGNINILAAESLVENSEEDYPMITLGSKIKGEGLTISTSYTPVVKGGREGLMSGVQPGAGAEYILVDIDDSWAYDLPIYTGTSSIVTVNPSSSTSRSSTSSE